MPVSTWAAFGLFLGAISIAANTANPKHTFSLAMPLLVVCSFVDRRTAGVVLGGLLCLNGVRLPAGGLPILPEHVAMLALWYHGSRNGDLRPQRTYRVLAFSALTAWLAILLATSLLRSPDAGLSLKLLGWQATSLTFMLLVWRLPTADRLLWLREVARGVVFVLAIYIGAWAISLISHQSSPLVEADYASALYRIQGFAQEPNVAAAIALSTLASAYVARRLGSRCLGPLGVAICVIVIVGSFTRAAMVGLALLGLLVALPAIKQPRFVVAGCLLGASLLVAFAIHPPTTENSGRAEQSFSQVLAERISTITDVGSGTGKFRINTVDVAFQDLQEMGLNGLGFNSFPQRHRSAITGDGRSYLGVLPVALLYDGGVLGFIAFFAAWVFLVRAGLPRSWLLPIVLLIVSTATNVALFAFPWVYMALLGSTTERNIYDQMASKAKLERLSTARVENL